MDTTRDILRRCVFTPYIRGAGPTFRLVLWDTHQTDCGKCVLGYCLTMHCRRGRVVLFEGEDFCASPLHAIDSDETIAGLMGFLTLRPGDTDPEYFADYTTEQLDYCSQHAEALSCEVSARFGEC